MTQQHYEEREKNITEPRIPQSWSQPHVYSSGVTFHILLQNLISHFNVSFCSMAVLSLCFQGQLLIVAEKETKMQPLLLPFAGGFERFAIQFFSAPAAIGSYAANKSSHSGDLWFIES